MSTFLVERALLHSTVLASAPVAAPQFRKQPPILSHSLPLQHHQVKNDVEYEFIRVSEDTASRSRSKAKFTNELSTTTLLKAKSSQLNDSNQLEDIENEPLHHSSSSESFCEVPLNSVDPSNPMNQVTQLLSKLMKIFREKGTNERGEVTRFSDISKSIAFREFTTKEFVTTLNSLDLSLVGQAKEQKLAFLLNLFNVCVMHARALYGHKTVILKKIRYSISGHNIALSDLEDILVGSRCSSQQQDINRCQSFPFLGELDLFDFRDPRAHFGVHCGFRGNPTQLTIYNAENLDEKLEECKIIYMKQSRIFETAKKIFLPKPAEDYLRDVMIANPMSDKILMLWKDLIYPSGLTVSSLITADFEIKSLPLAKDLCYLIDPMIVKPNKTKSKLLRSSLTSSGQRKFHIRESR